MRDRGEALARGFEPRFAARFFFARGAHRFKRLARGAVGFGKAFFGRRARIGGRAARIFRRLDLVHQSAAQAQKFVRRLGELFLLGVGFLEA